MYKFKFYFLFLKYSRTRGATSSPNSLIAFIISSCGIEPSGRCNINLSNPNVSIISISLFATVEELPTNIDPSGPTLFKYCSKVSGLQNGLSFEIASTTCFVGWKYFLIASSSVSAMKPHECEATFKRLSSNPECFPIAL